MKRIIKLILIVIISFILFMSIFIIVERILYRKEENRRILSATNSINQSKLKEFRFKPNRKKKLTEHVLPINKNKHNKEKIKKLQEVSARIKNENIIFEKIASDSLKKAREKYNKLPKNKQKVLRDKLTEAAKANDLLTVKKLVHQGVLISDISFRNGNWSGYENFTPIIQATVEGNLEILEYLLKYREFDLQNSKIFLKSQADPELTSGLVEALRNDHPKIAIFLMKSGASHASLPQGCIISFEYTPMYIAINKEYTKVVEYLIMSGIKVDEMHLQKAIETKNSEIENIIRTNLAKENNYDYLIAKNIVMKGQDSKLSVLDSLFTAGLDINFAGGCLLRLACKHNQFEMAKFLLERKADPNQYYVVDKKNRWRQSFNSCDMRSNITALMLACKNINYQIVDLLIKNNADINAADILTLQGVDTALDVRISVNEDDIDVNEIDISNHTTSINNINTTVNGHTVDINQNSLDIAALQVVDITLDSRVTDNENDISSLQILVGSNNDTLEIRVSANETNIATNSGNISNNADTIAANSSDIDDIQSNIIGINNDISVNNETGWHKLQWFGGPQKIKMFLKRSGDHFIFPMKHY